MWKVGDGGAYCCCVGGEGVSDVVLTAAVVWLWFVWLCGVEVVVVLGSSCRNLKENKTPANSDQCSQSTSTVGHPTGRLIRRKE